VLLQIQAVTEIKPGFDPDTAVREFRILASDYIASVLLGEAGQKISECAPAITLNILPPSPDAIERLDRGDFDLLVLPKNFTSSAHPSQMLFEESYTCIVCAGNKAIGNTLTLDEYMRAGHVSTRYSETASSYEEWFFRSSGFERRIEVSTTNFSSMPYFVIGTKRIATMHTRLAQTLARYFPIRLVAPPVEIPKLEMCMQWNSFLDRDPAHVWLRNLLAEVAAGGTPAPDAGSGQIEQVTAAGYAPPAQIAA
jgi:DNA-binding transcriptional LysR family regulator